jgi:hypothetical protein
MQAYFSKESHARLRVEHPQLYENYAGYDGEKVRDGLRKSSKFDPDRVRPYVIFPLDSRWLYFETEGKLLNRPRPELYQNLNNNEFLITVPEPRKESEARPILLNTAFDLHLHDRGSVGFPVEVVVEESMAGTLFAAHSSAPQRRSNLVPEVWDALKNQFSLKGDLSGKDACRLTSELVRVCLALCHSPQYQSEHKESLAQDWAHVPIPKSRELFNQLRDAGEMLGVLLNPLASPSRPLKAILGDESKQLAVPSKIGGGNVEERDLLIEYSFFGAAQGGWRQRTASANEPMYDQWGETTGDLFINDAVFFRHIPEKVWRYELGGYPVIKKWPGYRDRGRRPGVPLSVQETTHLRGMVQRLCAVLSLHAKLDSLYERACRDCFSVEELGL